MPKTGKQLWKYDPEGAAGVGPHARAATSSTAGVAVYEGKVYHRHARRAPDRARCEDGQAAVGNSHRRHQAAPLHHHRRTAGVNGKVIIGNGGAEFGVRGYVSAYDANTGKQVWRFYTVPGDPANGVREQGHGDGRQDLDAASGGSSGGGGTVWDSMAYDPELNRSTSAPATARPGPTSCAAPARATTCSSSSIVALDADTGEYVWHYQTTPGDTWDYDRHPADDAGRPRDRRQEAQGADAGAEERLLLRARPQRRQADLRRASSSTTTIARAASTRRPGVPFSCPTRA